MKQVTRLKIQMLITYLLAWFLLLANAINHDFMFLKFALMFFFLICSLKAKTKLDDLKITTQK